MNPFYLDDVFCGDIDDLLLHLEIDKEDVNDLPENWQVEVTEAVLEPIFQVDHNDLDNLAESLIETEGEYRMNEDWYEEHSKIIKKLFAECFDAEKFNAGIPKLWYGENGKDRIITKADLL